MLLLKKDPHVSGYFLSIHKYIHGDVLRVMWGCTIFVHFLKNSFNQGKLNGINESPWIFSAERKQTSRS